MFEKNGFQKSLRLLRKTQFQDTLINQSPLLGSYFTLFYHANGLKYPRLGIIVGKKKIPLAVLRNRIKRQARESFRLHQTVLPGYDIVVVTRQQAAGAGKCGLRQCLDKLLQQLVLLAKKSS